MVNYCNSTVHTCKYSLNENGDSFLVPMFRSKINYYCPLYTLKTNI